MPLFRIEAFVPAPPEQVFRHVTAFPARGAPDIRLLEERYGRLLDQEGDSYTFEEKSEAATRWRYTFTPPSSRFMEAVGSTWADRIDTFEASGQGTRWIVGWNPKSRGFPAFVQWLVFKHKGRQQAYDRLVPPVIEAFQSQGYY